jgi:hypothetical protein
MPERSAKEGGPGLLAVANAAALSRDAARRADTADVVAMETPYGKAVVHLDRHGADVQLPSGATVHVRFDDR